ncbi:MAG: TIR domain-containing protein [Candidatus Paceibacterota bacterium]
MSGGTRFSHFESTLLRARDWQERPQLDAVCRWWADGGAGVCALLGIGGAGKTAIADRFLQLLPNVLPPHPNVGNRDDLPPPERLFVFSFYDAPNPDSFFLSLNDFLHAPTETRNASERPHASYQQTLLALKAAGPCLLILDGLERVQDDGLRSGVFGELEDGRLSDLLVRVAEGYLPDVSVLITSRFPLAKLEEQGSVYYSPIPVEDIEPPAAVALLRQRGVHGTDDQLRSIAAECGHHVLTVDLAGGFIAEFGAGDPATHLRLTRFDDETQARRAEPTNARRRRVRLQEYRFARIAERYREGFKETDPAALAILERICLFRLGVTSDMLVSIFTGDGEEKQPIAGPALSGLTAEQLQQRLDHLEAMKLIERISDEHEAATPEQHASTALQHARFRYSIHPAVRDGFLSGLNNDTRRQGHEAAREGLSAALGDQPGVNPSDPATLDLLEEIIHHTLQAGHIAEAWGIYQNRLGGCRNLLARLNDYVRVTRVTRSILQACDGGDSLPDSDLVVLRSDFGYSSLKLGNLAAAASVLSKGLELCRRTRNSNAQVLLGNLSCALLDSGHLKTALTALRDSLPELRIPEAILRVLTRIAEIELLQGAVQITITEADVAKLTGEDLPSTVRQSLPMTIRNAAPVGYPYVTKLKQHINDLRKEYPTGHSQLADACLDLSQSLLCQAETGPATSNVSTAREWAIAHDAEEILCRCALVVSRIELAEAAPTPDKRANAEPSSLNSTPMSHASAHTFSAAEKYLSEGLKIARDCGYGIYHIDLLLERARLHLLRGEPQAALDDLRVALEDGIPANDKTGQSELLAATHIDCGYAWAIPAGLHLRGEALLLQAAQSLGSDSFVVAKRLELPENVQALIKQAEACLDQSLQLWHALGDPEPNSVNFIHPETGTAYNYRAAETYGVIKALNGGTLTDCHVHTPESEQCGAERGDECRECNASGAMKDFFVSYNRNDEQWAEWIAWTLEEAGFTTVIQAWDFRAGGDFVTEMQKAATGTRKTIAVLSDDYLAAEYTQPEWGNAFARDPQGHERTLIPVRVKRCKPDGLLMTRIYVDLIGLPADDAQEMLLESLKDRGKPANSPAFPGSGRKVPSTAATNSGPQVFPGHASGAVDVWREKLEFLRTQQAITSDASQNFALKKQIEEAEQKIRELGNRPVEGD